jgi:putative copper resistance protein D
MQLLVDVFGYLSIILHGVTIVGQATALGSVMFLVFLARPSAWMIGATGAAVITDTVRIARWATLVLVVGEVTATAMQLAVLVTTTNLDLGEAIGAQFAIAGAIKVTAALALFGLLALRDSTISSSLLLVAGACVLAAGTLTTHAIARVEDRALLLGATMLHQFGAAIWIGGIPAFVAALRRGGDSAAWRMVGERFSIMSQIGVGAILLSASVLTTWYIGSVGAAYGTAYGVMAGAKAVMFGALLLLGLGNFRLIRSLRPHRDTSITRLRRFAEVEIGIGFTLFFAAASLTSVPPGVDLTQDRVTWHEIVERNRPEWPRFVSPDHDSLALPALQAKLDAEATAGAQKPLPAFVPGAGLLPDRNASDIAWSEYNHHWAGLFVIAIALLALANQAGLRAARHWPVLFLGLAGFLFFRSDPETWPMGDISFLDSLRDVEVLQHRFYVLLLIGFAVFEWRVRLGWMRSQRMTLVFPLLTAIGAAALLTHSHAIANIKDQLLIELTHTPLALAGMAAGWARWLELRLDPGRGQRIAGWTWPLCFLLVGLSLVGYREA